MPNFNHQILLDIYKVDPFCNAKSKIFRATPFFILIIIQIKIDNI